MGFLSLFFVIIELWWEPISLEIKKGRLYNATMMLTGYNNGGTYELDR